MRTYFLKLKFLGRAISVRKTKFLWVTNVTELVEESLLQFMNQIIQVPYFIIALFICIIISSLYVLLMDVYHTKNSQ